MKKTDIVVTKQNDVDVIKYDLKASDVYDDKAADKAASLQNIIPFQYSDEDGKRTITSYVREQTTLEMLFKKTLNKKQVLSIIKGLVSVYEMGAQGIPVSYIVKEPSYVYINESTYEVKCILIAIKQDVLPLAEIPVFFREVISKMIFDENDKDNYVAKMLSIINAADFSIGNLKGYVEKEIEVTGKPAVQNQVKVNKLGVMNNIQNANRQAQMQGQPPQGMGAPMQPNMPKPQGMPPVQPPQGMGAPVTPNMPKPQGMPPVQPPQGMGAPMQPNMPKPQGMPPVQPPQGMGAPMQPNMPKPQGMPPVQPPQGMGAPVTPNMPKP
ncbi:MAG: hypothetical protein NC220_00135, partial [Clostridium sp.]|nr:hypothetical protein [Clostridium sp.]